MPKFNLDLNMDQGVAEGYEAYAGPLPKTGSYTGILKICQIAKTSQKAKNPGAPMLKLGVQLTDADPKEAIGFVAFRNLVLIDSVVPFLNQFLLSLTDGSDEQLAKIQKAFKNNLIVDDSQKNVIKIGPWKVNSPNGELPVKVSVQQRSFTSDGETRTTCGISSFLLSDNAISRNGSSEDETPVEEDYDDSDIVDLDLDDEDESVLDDD